LSAPDNAQCGISKLENVCFVRLSGFALSVVLRAVLNAYQAVANVWRR
jgi:hypothetical protein